MQIGMECMDRTCAFTGHRASKLPWGFREDDPRCLYLKQMIYDTAEAVYQAGVRHYICGMANGCDLYFCEAVLRLREEHPDITLEAAVPFARQAAHWPPSARERYDRLLRACDVCTVLQDAYTDDCMLRRNRYMVDRADLLIAAFSGKSGGTMSTIRYALSRGLEIIELPVVSSPR